MLTRLVFSVTKLINIIAELTEPCGYSMVIRRIFWISPSRLSQSNIIEYNISPPALGKRSSLRSLALLYAVRESPIFFLTKTWILDCKSRRKNGHDKFSFAKCSNSIKIIGRDHREFEHIMRSSLPCYGTTDTKLKGGAKWTFPVFLSFPDPLK